MYSNIIRKELDLTVTEQTAYFRTDKWFHSTAQDTTLSTHKNGNKNWQNICMVLVSTYWHNFKQCTHSEIWNTCLCIPRVPTLRFKHLKCMSAHFFQWFLMWRICSHVTVFILIQLVWCKAAFPGWESKVSAPDNIKLQECLIQLNYVCNLPQH
jgi:hypothetical protein